MKSMTGFAKQTCIAGTRKYTIEIKTLNSKALDLIVKEPASLRSHELEIRSLMNQLERGKVEVLISEETNCPADVQLNSQLVEQRYRELQALSAKLGCKSDNLLDAAIAMPDTWNTAEAEELGDEAWHLLADTLQKAIDEVNTFRKQEGAVLEKDFHKHIDAIEQRLLAIPQYENERIDTAKERIHKYFTEAAIKEIDTNRFEQELIYYLEKLDITEEKIRLAKHIAYFRTTMAEEEGSGKKLGFIAQEMGREINTTGSKANHVEIQKLVVEMKDELEKIKEQLGNIL